jgi:hypothetical protein
MDKPLPKCNIKRSDGKKCSRVVMCSSMMCYYHYNIEYLYKNNKIDILYKWLDGVPKELVDDVIKRINFISLNISLKYRFPNKLYEKPEDCPICCDSLSKQLFPLSCGHWAHRHCMDSWIKKRYSCPICSKKNITYI